MRFVELSSAAMAALLDGSLAEASREAGIALTPYFVTDDAVRLWRLRVSQIAADPGSARWVAPAVVPEPEGVVAGRAGFHGPPDQTGMVEVAYSVDPAYPAPRVRQGDARGAAAPRRCQTRWQHRPGNDQPRQRPSLATISGFGFTKIGEQWDEEDGRELIFEVAPRTLPADLPGHCRRSPRPRPHR